MNQWNRIDENWLKDNNYYGNNKKWWSDLNTDKYKKNKSGTVKLITGYEMQVVDAGADKNPNLADYKIAVLIYKNLFLVMLLQHHHGNQMVQIPNS